MPGFLKKSFNVGNYHPVYTEVLAGATTFAAMSYIIAVQPTLMAQVGMDFGSVMAATCIASAVATLLMGVMANYPIALAPAMGHNFYFVFGVCAAMGVSWQVALGANFIAGAIFVLLSAVGFRERLIDSIPDNLKHAIAGGIGMLIAFVGLQWGGIVVSHPETLVRLGNLTSPVAITSITGLAVVAALHTLRVRGAVIIGMLAALVVGLSQGILSFKGIIGPPPSIAPTLLKLDIAGAMRPEMIEVVFVLFFLALFDTVGTLIGVAEQAGLLVNGKLPRARRALLADSLSIVQGTLWGASTISSYVESATGVSEGGRTGMANVVTALLLLGAMLFYPLVQTIASPVVTRQGYYYPVMTAPLVLIGTLMLASVSKIDWSAPDEAIPAFLCMAIMPFSFSIADGIGFGIIAHCLLKLTKGRARDIDWMTLLFAAMFAARYIIA